MISLWFESLWASRCLPVSAGANCSSGVVGPPVGTASSCLLAAVCMKSFRGAMVFLTTWDNRFRTFPQKLKGEAETLRQLRVADDQCPGLLARCDQRHEHNLGIEDD